MNCRQRGESNLWSPAVVTSRPWPSDFPSLPTSLVLRSSLRLDYQSRLPGPRRSCVWSEGNPGSPPKVFLLERLLLLVERCRRRSTRTDVQRSQVGSGKGLVETPATATGDRQHAPQGSSKWPDSPFSPGSWEKSFRKGKVLIVEVVHCCRSFDGFSWKPKHIIKV